MKKTTLILACSLAALLAISTAFAGESKCGGCCGAEKTMENQAASNDQKYTCEMHPEVVSDKPGKCPKCGMNLVPKKDGK